MDKTIEKINNYLQVGGLFNPELMEHHKVSDLLLECRNELTKASDENERLRAALREIVSLDDEPKCCGKGIAGYDSPPECCGDPERGIDRAQSVARAALEAAHD